MNKETTTFLEFIEIIDNLARLHEWEIKNLPILNSLTGRLLYYRIAQRAIKKDVSSSSNRTMKELISDSGFTERSLRSRLISMEEEGFVIPTKNMRDGRSRFPIPDEKMYAAMYLHASQAKRIMEESYLLIKK